MFGRRKPELAGRRPYAREGGYPAAFSYHANRSIGMDGAQGRGLAVAGRSRRINWALVPTVLSVCCIIAAVLYSTTLAPRARVSIMGGDRTTLLRSTSSYEDAADTILRSSIWNGSKLTIDTVGVGEKLKQQFPELTEASVTIPLLGRQPTLQLVSEQPVVVVAVDGADYYVSSSGRAIMRVQDASERPSVLRLVDQVGLSAKVGEQLLPRDTIMFIQEVVRQFAARHVDIEQLVLPAIPNELHVKPANKPYSIKFSTLGNARLQSGTYLAVANKLDATHITPQEYVDVRVEERAFYK